MKWWCAGLMLLGTVVLAAAGCDDLGLPAGRPDVGEESRTLGVVTFHAATTIDPQGAPAASSERFTVEGRFVRYGPPFESEAREVLGLADLDALPPVDECSAATSGPTPALASRAGVAPAAGIELLDVGRIMVDGAGAEEALAVRTFPDLLDVMSGVTYGGTSTLPYRPGRSYAARGDADRSPWFAVDAPPGWDDLRVNGSSIGVGLVGTFEPAPRLELRWIPWTDRASDVVLTLFWTGADGASHRLVCRPADDGAFDVPAAALAQLPAAPDLADLTLRLERVVRVSFPLDRVDEAEAIFRVSLTTPVR